ncbi:hypothetical protein C5167_021926 [Papaver somniferum]|uniref:Cytochrome b561 domain-containing protein n=1 Tax=Papaver somniferum TaxID=3469 RepID=A0A4Y7JG99_PAPSO|nr:hypothetical protein C5167_021926 [Papaver somniferum]
METSNKATASPSSKSSNLIIFARLSSLLVLHYLVMVIGFVIISGEAILVHKCCPGSKNLKKLVHLTMQEVALASGIFGIRANFYLIL